ALGRWTGPDTGPEAAAMIAAARAWWAGAIPPQPDALWALARYTALRPALPPAQFSADILRAGTLADLTDRYDAFILDAYGVLNRGDAAIPGAPERIAALQRKAKRVLVLTNGASLPPAAARAKYARWGFAFDPADIIASRALAAAALPALQAAHPGPWAAIGPADAGLDDLPGDIRPLEQDLLADAAGFLFLGAQTWTDDRQAALEAALEIRPRPVLCANPDLVAPLETGFSREPGAFCHRLARLGHAVHFTGKPYPAAFAAARARLPGIPAHRIAMVGDSPHTDILGAAAAGLASVLVTAHGLLRGLDPGIVIAATGIRPDAICPDP
ncbi:MAG: TIGR01459 family HAD-type hydrolase, partial [Gemmobacter sp.]